MKKWMIAASIVIVIGCGLFVGAMTMIDWNFEVLSTDKFTTNTHTVTDTFADIVLTTDTAAVTFLPSETDAVTVECFESERQQHTVTVQDGTLTIALQDTRKWYHYIGLSFRSPKITVYLPAGEYGTLTLKSHTGKVDLSADFTFKNVDMQLTTGNVTCAASATGDVTIRTDTGDITVDRITADSLSLKVTTGRVTVKGADCQESVTVKVTTGKAHLTDVTCRDLVSDGSTGDIALKNVVAANRFSIERSTGDVTFERCDAAELWVETSTGSVKGTLLTDKVFITSTDTGRVDVPKSVTGGRCEITTDTGDIKITVG